VGVRRRPGDRKRVVDRYVTAEDFCRVDLTMDSDELVRRMKLGLPLELEGSGLQHSQLEQEPPLVTIKVHPRILLDRLYDSLTLSPNLCFKQ
jgi:hypothetical protein